MEKMIPFVQRHTVVHRCRIVLVLLLLGISVFIAGGKSVAAEKILESIKIGSFKDKSRVVLQLSSAGFYEIDDQPDKATLLVKLFDFNRGQVPPRQLVEERLLKGIQVSQEEQFLQVKLSLVTSLYHYRAHLFKSPPMLVIDFTGRPPAEQKKISGLEPSKNDELQASSKKLKAESPEMSGVKDQAEPEEGIQNPLEPVLVRGGPQQHVPAECLNCTRDDGPVESPGAQLFGERRRTGSEIVFVGFHLLVEIGQAVFRDRIEGPDLVEGQERAFRGPAQIAAVGGGPSP